MHEDNWTIPHGHCKEHKVLRDTRDARSARAYV